MRRADRLFQIVQYLRSRRLTTAQWLAERLEISVRTVYRDVQDLQLSGVPIEGEAGVGYCLRHKLDLPPLLFTSEELDALLVGLRMTQAWSDPQLAQAAETALSKIETVLPAERRHELRQARLYAPNTPSAATHWISPLRQAIKKRHKVNLDYRLEDGTASARVVWPLGLFFWGKVWTLTAWCELRGSFRNFRLDRITHFQALTDNYPHEAGRTLDDYLIASSIECGFDLPEDWLSGRPG